MKKHHLIFFSKKPEIKRIHFVGIGGVGMSGLALILKNMGFYVSGSDIKRSPITEHLEKVGVKVFYEHKKENVEGCQVVVYSSAIPLSNPEIVYAKSLSLPVIPRAEMLGELMRIKYAIAISGTHGKTTTTSLIAKILEQGNLDPTVIIGGRILNMDSGARLGRSDYLVCEADESDKSFLALFPTVAVVTNIEPEHLDHYGNLSSLKEAFLEFLNRVPFFGVCVLNEDSEILRELKPFIKRRFITYGFLPEADVSIKKITLQPFRSFFTLYRNEKEWISLETNLLGRHNVLNCAAAAVCASHLGVKERYIIEGVKEFVGIERRLEKKGVKKGVLVYDDYAHHPTEVKATLEALRNAYKKRRIIAVFQPHRYTRTFYLWEAFGDAFLNADIVIVTEIYPAGEAKIPGVSGKMIYDAVISKKEDEKQEIYFVEEFNEIVPLLKKIAKEKDVIITLGAGNIWEIGKEFLAI